MLEKIWQTTFKTSETRKDFLKHKRQRKHKRQATEQEKISAIEINYKELIPKIFKLRQQQKANNLTEQWTKVTNRQITEEKANKHTKTCPTSSNSHCTQCKIKITT